MLARAAGKTEYHAWIEKYDRSRREPIHVVKAHYPWQTEKLNRTAALTCYRDLRDVVRSVRRMGWAEAETPADAVRLLDRYVHTLEAWTQGAVHITRYEDIVANPRIELRNIASALRFNISSEAIDRAHQQLSELVPPPGNPSGATNDFDADSLLHRGHCSVGWNCLDEETSLLIEERFGDWLIERGYVNPARRGRRVAARDTLAR